jgi:hypothetical protein
VIDPVLGRNFCPAIVDVWRSTSFDVPLCCETLKPADADAPPPLADADTLQPCLKLELDETETPVVLVDVYATKELAPLAAEPGGEYTTDSTAYFAGDLALPLPVGGHFCATHVPLELHEPHSMPVVEHEVPAASGGPSCHPSALQAGWWHT